MSTVTNGFTFSFPEVKRAYKTSIRRKLSSDVVGTIFGGSLLIAIVVGIAVYFLHVGLENLIYNVSGSSNTATLYAILALGGYPLIIGFGSYFVGNSVGKSAIRAKFPDAETIGKLALVIGLIAYLSYLTMFMLFYYAPERFDHWLDYIRQAFYLIVFVGVVWGASTFRIEETPFCENCNEFMISDDIGEQNMADGNKGLDIAQESTIINILISRQFAKLIEIDKDWSRSNYCLLQIWHCPVCNNNGFIDCTTYQSRTTVSNGQMKTDAALRLIHSSHIDGEDIKTLMQAKQTLGTPIIKS
jgi:hypothetical protein